MVFLAIRNRVAPELDATILGRIERLVGLSPAWRDLAVAVIVAAGIPIGRQDEAGIGYGLAILSWNDGDVGRFVDGLAEYWAAMYSLRDGDRLSPEILRFEKAHIEARAVRRPGAAAIDLAYVAAGVFDGFWERNLSSWDICAGALLVREAGGKVTSYDGGPFEMHGNQILATNGHIHDAILKILAETKP